MQLKIERIHVRDVQTQKGPAKRIGVLCNNVWYNCWGNQTSNSWQVGQTIDVEVTEKEYQGKKSWEIVFPKKGSDPQVMETLKVIVQKLDEVLQHVAPRTVAPDENPAFDPNEDIPF